MATLVASTVKTALELYLGLEWGKNAVAYKDSIRNDTVTLYDLGAKAVTVRAPELLHYTDKLFTTDQVSAAITGTAIAGGVTEAQIVNGGETIIITLTNGTWPAAGTAFDAIRQSILDAITSASSGTYSFATAVRAIQAVSTVVRTSSTVVTITLTAAASYGIVIDDTVSISIPANCFLNSAGATVNRAITPATAPTFTVTAGVPTIAAAGTIISGGVLESAIVTGGETLTLTVTGAIWAASGAAFNAQRQGIISGLDGNHAEAHSWDTDIKAGAAVTAVVRTSDSVATFTTPAAATYSITTTDEVVTPAIPRTALVHSVSGEAYSGAAFVTSPTTFTITQGS